MDYLVKYGFSATAESVAAALGQISAKLPEKPSSEVLKACFAAMDLTTLRTNDTVAAVEALVDKANRVADEFPGCPLPASVCVYPNFASTVRGCRRSPELHVTTVAGCFPSSQSYLEVKVMECRLAVRNGADEVDIVLALDPFLSGDYAAVAAEISEMRKAVDEEGAAAGRKVVLKVILETGLLASVERIAAASFLAMEAGADFIKTSTGKVDVNATPEAAYVMCECIRLFHEKTGLQGCGRHIDCGSRPLLLQHSGDGARCRLALQGSVPSRREPSREQSARSDGTENGKILLILPFFMIFSMSRSLGPAVLLFSGAGKRRFPSRDGFLRI